MLDIDVGSELDEEQTDVQAVEAGSDIQLFSALDSAGNVEAEEYTEVQDDDEGSVIQLFRAVTSLDVIPVQGQKIQVIKDLRAKITVLTSSRDIKDIKALIKDILEIKIL